MADIKNLREKQKTTTKKKQQRNLHFYEMENGNF